MAKAFTAPLKCSLQTQLLTDSLKSLLGSYLMNIFTVTHTLHPGVPLCLRVPLNTTPLYITHSSDRLICLKMAHTHTSALTYTQTNNMQV